MSVHDALPVYHHVERHALRVAAPPEQALDAARATRLEDVPLVRRLLRLRGLRVAGGPIWDALVAQGFQPFDDQTLVLVGRPWSPREGLRAVDDFVAFAEPGWAKIAVDLTAVADGGGARLETETRIYLTDRSARRRFAVYWAVVRPFSGLVRIGWLRAARRRAEV